MTGYRRRLSYTAWCRHGVGVALRFSAEYNIILYCMLYIHINMNTYTGMFPVGDTSCRTLIAVCVCVCVCVRRHIAILRQE